MLSLRLSAMQRHPVPCEAKIAFKIETHRSYKSQRPVPLRWAVERLMERGIERDNLVRGCSDVELVEKPGGRCDVALGLIGNRPLQRLGLEQTAQLGHFERLVDAQRRHTDAAPRFENKKAF